MIDSHIHFWNPPGVRIPWVADVPQFNKPYVPDDLFAAAGDVVQIDQMVFVEADVLPADALKEVEWVSSLQEQTPQIAAIVAFAPVEYGAAVREHLEALKQYPMVRGVRQVIQSRPSGLAAQHDFIAGVQLLAEFDLSFDICIYHHQLPDVLKLVEACPDVAFVLDHIGKPDIKNGVLDPWREHITALAAYPHVMCKFSGMVTEADHQHWQVDDLRPYATHILESFGPERLMFGGDWPVVNFASDYATWATTAWTLLAELDSADRDKIFTENARRFYRL